MNAYLDQYKLLDTRLTWVRWTHRGMRSDEEEAILEEMDQVWRNLDESEREMLSTVEHDDQVPDVMTAPAEMMDEAVHPRECKPVRRPLQVA